MFAWFGLAAFLVALLAVLRAGDLYLRAKRISRIDPKTGALSERGFTEALADEIRRSRRHLRPLTVVYIDLDNFKPINDLLGYSAGDSVLRLVAQTTQSTLREVDSVARRQGDEFALLLKARCETSSRRWMPYRAGGDEFAVILTDGNVSSLKLVNSRQTVLAILNTNAPPDMW